MEGEKQEEKEARQRGREAQSLSPEMGRGSWAGSSQPQLAGKLRPGGFWPRAGGVWWPQHPCAQALSLVLAHRPQAGSLT